MTQLLLRWLGRWRGRAAARPGGADPHGYPGDFDGTPELEYAPNADGRPDPGEVVWAWVPFEEDHSRGKDRPVLIIGRDRELLLGLMLTSKDHDRDAAYQASRGRCWLDIGTGAWDRQRRPSEVRLDRILRLHPDRVRRAGTALPRTVFDQVADGVLSRRAAATPRLQPRRRRTPPAARRNPPA